MSSIFVNLCQSDALFGTQNNGNTQFSALFSYMLWYINLKFCIRLSFYEFLIKFECRQFASIFVGALPLLEPRMQGIYRFPHFSPTCYDILTWNFVYDFPFHELLIKFECRHFSSIVVGVMSLSEIRILEMHSFLYFCPICFDILSWFFLWTSDQVIDITWGQVWRSYAPFGCAVLHTCMLWDLAEVLDLTLFSYTSFYYYFE